MTSRHLHELIDACRPGHADMDQPEFSELARELAQDLELQRLFERSQQLDAAIRTTFQSVTPPPGLVERLLEVIEPASITNREGTPVVATLEPLVEPAKRSSRRSFAMRTGVASLSAVAAAITLWLTMPQPISTPSEQEIAEDVFRWNAELVEANWQTTANMPSQDFPTWQHLAVGSNDHWQWVSKRRIACYDFDTSLFAEGATVRLFVSKPTAPVALPGTPPVGYPSSGGWYIGAWQANGRVYYLAVQAGRDSKRLYSNLIGSSGPPA
ncbi:MAG: hypothetical protein O3C40_27565 [Planctomycetota bacterium]|nr:hypothetical protein [Planctomycetota bacterium]